MENWITTENALTKTFVFNDFVEAIGFISMCAIEIEKLNHHPSWTNTYNKIEVTLTTHDSGNKVTQKDYQLADILDKHFQKFRK